jgi:hypothetical protein
MLGSRYLREVPRFCRVFLVTGAAQLRHVRQFGHMRRWIVCVLRQRAVAGFTSHMGMFARGPGFRLVVVAEHTRILAGESNRPLADLCQRSRRVVSILPKSFGNEGGAKSQEKDHANEQNDGRHNQMSGIAKQAAHRSPPFSRVN